MVCFLHAYAAAFLNRHSGLVLSFSAPGPPFPSRWVSSSTLFIVPRFHRYRICCRRFFFASPLYKCPSLHFPSSLMRFPGFPDTRAFISSLCFCPRFHSTFHFYSYLGLNHCCLCPWLNLSYLQSCPMVLCISTGHFLDAFHASIALSIS